MVSIHVQHSECPTQWAGPGIALWIRIWSKIYDQFIPYCIDLATCRRIQFTTARDGSRTWTIVDNRGDPHAVLCIEWQRVNADGQLTSDMAILMPYVIDFEAKRVQASQASREAARMPVLIETAPIRDPIRSPFAFVGTLPNSVGLSSDVPRESLDGAGLMAGNNFFPQNSSEASQQMGDILNGTHCVG
jgi:hypothetical protein